ncbi:MAG: type I glyceraldehyde-3-phosphate dehydrogenase [Bacteroidetes bacterium]|jgi:glyceraldehyde 3-phosphate dehydrogenase|nr:type I glyceraldehyde-3-phosphate dehydrogenase [Bacteroidota bacterium]
MKVAINGFGRIGRLAYRNLLTIKEVDVIAVNDLTEVNMLAHLLKFDSAHGRFNGDVQVVSQKELKVNGEKVNVYAERNPEDLPWDSLGVDVVLECTGVFRTAEKAGMHLTAGAKKVILSAPAKGGNVRTIVLGVNEHELEDGDNIISNASCTTNCLAPMAKVVNDLAGIDTGFITTAHAYTADQRLQDAPHQKDYRRARAAAHSIIPTSTGAAKTVGLVLPELNGKLDGMALRVPVITGSITDCTFTLNQEVSAEEVNAAMKAAAEGPMKGVLEYTEDPIVSADIVGSTYSCIFDAGLTMVKGNLLKMSGWYDNEYGYATRAAELVQRLA